MITVGNPYFFTGGGGGGGSDPYFSSVVLLLHCDGTNNGTTFTDNSGSAHSMTANNSAVTSTAEKKFGTASLSLTTAADSVSTPGSADFAFGTGDFTVEFWVYTSASGANLIGVTTGAGTSSGWNIILYASDLYWQFNGSNIASRSAAGFTDGAWHHIAVCRSSGTTRIFYDGVKQGADISDSNDITNSSDSLYIGPKSYWGDLDGYIDDLRITKGVARYTSNFTAPSAAHPDS